MRRIGIKDAMPGMLLARSIHSTDGRVLLRAGVAVSQRYLTRLEQLGILYFYIIDEALGEIVYQPGLASEETIIEAMSAVKESFEALGQRRQIQVQRLKEVVDTLISEIMANQDALHGLSAINAHDDYTYAHSVDVCLLSLVTGATMQMEREQLKNLGVGALLHDIGKTMLPQELLNKPSTLTEEEYGIIKKHCDYGFEIMRHYREISLLSAHVAYQHHECWDGGGYPRGLCGKEIHDLARIVAVADTYDALLGQRPYREAYSVPEALDMINQMSGQNFEPGVTSALTANISIYPPGAVVELNTGHFAVVVECHREDPARPLLRLIYTVKPLQLIPHREIDLRGLSTVRIIRVLHDAEVSLLLTGA